MNYTQVQEWLSLTAESASTYGLCVMQEARVCINWAHWIHLLGSVLSTGLLVSVRAATYAGTSFMTSLEVAASHCPLTYALVVAICFDFPEAFREISVDLNSQCLQRSTADPYDDIEQQLLTVSLWQLLFQPAPIFAALRILSFAHLFRWAHLHGGSAADLLGNCIANRSGPCWHVGVSSNASLLEVAERHRTEGLPAEYALQLMASPDGLARATGVLARLDRSRSQLDVGSTTMNFRTSIDLVETYLREALRSMPFATVVHNAQLCWYFLDKLTLPQVVPVRVSPPRGTDPSSLHRQVIHMFVMPGRDLVSDYVRRTATFHCPSVFGDELTQVGQGELRQRTCYTVAEVGGYLGDCLLWASAWLGPRLCTLLVEPVSAATKRYASSLRHNGLPQGPRMEIRSVAVRGNATQTLPGFLAPMSNPNTYHWDLSTAPTIDDEFSAWLPRIGDDLVDLVRIAATGPYQIDMLAGMSLHMARGRVRRLLVQTSDCKEAEAKRTGLQLASLFPDTKQFCDRRHWIVRGA
eukprot:CAMPEP_0117598064 /NCGR_PEP_ID=MMETSP0784-20121206/75201_1 /TAXON_ID=39447 /ORGANISM="" /LENGTH=523 /DNA_ID=CAMNT_0005400497 /DNA_START=103 /DNA_END=1674 /DNA_ORIENTATION=+